MESPEFWQGIEQFNQEEFYDCHDTLEAIWMDAIATEKNFYQGKFRLGEFDLKLINQAYLIDKIYSGYLTKDNMVVTCLDQRPNFELDVNKIVNHMMINNIYQSLRNLSC
jgi:hypothetical protein